MNALHLAAGMAAPKHILDLLIEHKVGHDIRTVSLAMHTPNFHYSLAFQIGGATLLFCAVESMSSECVAYFVRKYPATVDAPLAVSCRVW